MKTIAMIAAVLLLSACAKSPVRSAEATSAPAPSYAAPSPPAPAPAAAPAPAPAPLPAARTDVLGVRFKGVNEKGYPVVIVTNLTGKDIDDISGGFMLTDGAGNYLHSTGQTEAVPGVLFLAAGAEMELVPYGLSTKTEPMRLLQTEPENLVFTFESRTVTFMGEAAPE